MAQIIFNLIFEIVFIVAIGFYAKRKGILNSADEKSINSVCIRIVILFTILMSSQKEFSPGGAKAIGVTAIVAVLYFLLGIPFCMFAAKKTRLSEAKQKIFVASSIFSNITFIGLPVTMKLFGDIGVLCTSMFNAVSSLVCYTWGYAYVGSTGTLKFKNIFSNAISIVSIASIAFYFLQITIPNPLASACNAIAAANFPLSMLVIGCMLAEADLWDIIKNKEIYFVTILRMVIIPGVVFITLRFCGAEKIATKACTILAGLPVGTATSIMAAQYEVEKEYAVEIMMQSLFSMIIFLPLWVYIIEL